MLILVIFNTPGSGSAFQIRIRIRFTVLYSLIGTVGKAFSIRAGGEGEDDSKKSSLLVLVRILQGFLSMATHCVVQVANHKGERDQPAFEEQFY